MAEQFTLRFWISESIPAYTYELYYLSYDRKNDETEIGPILDPSKGELEVLKCAKNLFNEEGYIYIGKTAAQRKVKGAFTDCKDKGETRVFDCLFSDVDFYKTKFERFNEEQIHEKKGTTFNWVETFDSDHNLLFREERRCYLSKDIVKIVIDPLGIVQNITVMRGESPYKQYKMNLKTVITRASTSTAKHN